MPAPTYDGYPSADDVEALIAGAGITLPEFIDTDSMIWETIDAWEDETRYRPLWVSPDAAPADYSYDPPGPNKADSLRGGFSTFFGFGRVGGGRELRLRRGFVSIASVTVGVTPDSVGTVLVEGTDYRLMPVNAPAIDGEPYTSIQFSALQWGIPGSIVVNGVAGYSTVLKAEIWNAMRKDAASRVLKAIRERLVGSANTIKSASGAEVSYSASQLTLGDTWANEAAAVRRRKTLLG